LRFEIDVLNTGKAQSLAEGVYRVAAARTQCEYDFATDELFCFLDGLKRRFADDRRFLLGENVTLPDVLAFTPLVRFDAVHNPLFRATQKRLVDYRYLAAFVKRVQELPGVAETVHWTLASRRGIVPEAPS
jgi:glutathionyl-hydroquinone reductase